MILHSVQIENFKGIRGPVEIQFAEEVPNLVEGPNGVGKSTLVDAVERCLVETHNTSGANADEMRPRGTALTPSISVVFGHEGSVYRISKTFLDSPTAKLEKRRSDGTYDMIAKGKAADEQVREMLRSQPTRAKDKTGERLGLFSILCGMQGDQAISPLTGNALTDIRAMLGAQLAGGRGAAFERLIDKKHAAVWTPGGKPKKGKLTATQEALVGARADYQKCADLMSQVAGLEASAREQRASSETTVARLSDSRAECEGLRPVADQVVTLRARREPALSRVQAAKALYGQRRAELDRIVGLASTKKDCEEAHPALVHAEANAVTERRAAEDQARAAQEAWEVAARPNPELRTAEERIERAVSFVDLTREIERLAPRIERANAVAQRLSELERHIADINSPEAGVWRQIQALARELEQAATHVDALALRLEIAADAEFSMDVAAGTPSGPMKIAAGEMGVITGEGSIAIAFPGLARLRITGPSGDAADWREERDRADAKLRAAIAPFNVQKWNDLDIRVRERTTLDDEIQSARIELAGALGSETIHELEDDHSRASAARAAVLNVEPAWDADPPDLAAIRCAAAAIRSKIEATQNEARATWQIVQAVVANAEAALANAMAARAGNAEKLAATVQDLAKLEADGLTVFERQEKVADLRRELESAEDALSDVETALAALPADAPDRLKELLGKIDDLEAAVQSAREAYQQDEAGIRAILSQGPYTSLASAEERVRQLEEDEAAEVLRLEAINALKAAVDNAKEKALAGIAEPVEQRATELLERISGRPLARVRLGDGLAVDSIQPEGFDGEASVQQMSAGEQEQIYFATRLALAEVLAGQERQTLVLDDPLVNTDAERLANAVHLINEAAGRFQVVILTCHPDRYLEMSSAVSIHMAQLAIAGAAQ